MSSVTTMGVKLDIDTRTRLKELSTLKERTPHWMMKKAVLEYLEREEAKEREKIEDQKRWARYEARGRAIPQKQVDKWLNSIGTKNELPCPK